MTLWRNKSTGKAMLRLLSILATIGLFAMLLPFSAGTAAADTTSNSLMTDYMPTINETIDASGFKHPGIGLTKDILENVRTEVRAQHEPWNTYFHVMLQSSAASKTVGSANQSGSDPNKPADDAFSGTGIQGRFIADGLRSYTQALMYFITGDETYRANALHIIRIWSQMDPAKYVYFPDGHIHTGMALYRMVTAAEILRYSSTQDSSLAWTDQDTQDFTNNLIVPITDTFDHNNNYFMNQHLYPLIGAISGYIFTGNRDRYDQAVEWFTVNKTSDDQGQNGSIKQLFRLVDTNAETGEKVANPQVQITEMGRDQAHGTDDIINVSILSRLLTAQGTKVDPVDGTVSTAPDAVTPYDFFGKRILAGADYFARYMLGYDTPWIPTVAHSDADGNPQVIYDTLDPGYRGRLGGPGANMWDLYYYYKYTEGLNMQEVAPYYSAMFKMREPIYWDSQDAGGEYWLYLPKAAEAEGTQYLPKPAPSSDLREIEGRYTALDSHSTTMQEGDTSFVRITATEAGSKIALVGSGSSTREVGFRIRTDGIAKLQAFGDTIELPDTNGQWRYVYHMLKNHVNFDDLEYFTVIGSGTTVDIDNINVNPRSQLTPPMFKSGDAPLKLYGYVGSEAGIDYDFSATDAGASDTVTYQIEQAPEGAVLNDSTGVFSWKPKQAGTYDMVIEVSDGTTVSTRDVTIVVASDRQSAVDAVISTYQPGTAYVSSTLNAYKKVYEDAENAIAGTTDADFQDELSKLQEAVHGLQELTPLMEDGSIAYRNLLNSPDFDPYYVTDGTYNTFVDGTNLSLYVDFGPSFRVTAKSFQLQPRSAFPERGAGITVYGSDDKVNWTRLTPGITSVSEQPQTLTVSPDLQDKPYRFLKFQMIEQHDDLFAKSSDGFPMEEIGEFRIFGQRHEVVNKLSSVSISSDEEMRGRILRGDTATLSFTSTEAIQNVRATIQGQPTTIHTDDGLHWTATAVMGPDAPLGPVTFTLNYQTAAGVDAAETLFTTDGTRLTLADGSDIIRGVTLLSTVTDSYGRPPAQAIETANLLFDGNPATATDYRLNGSGSGGWVEFDFKRSDVVSLKDVELLSRQDRYYYRIQDAVIQGSNDNETWNTISTQAVSTEDWQTLNITDSTPYRYIRIWNGYTWFGNMAEVRFHGTINYDNASINADTLDNSAVQSPDGYTEASYYQYQQTVNKIKSELEQPKPDVKSILNEWLQSKSILKRVITPSMVTANTASWDGSYDAATNGWHAFDGDPGTFTDTKQAAGWVTVDYGQGKAIKLTGVKFIPRSGYASRMNGAEIQGSNDGVNFDTLYTINGITDQKWYTEAIHPDKAYRYLRYYTPNGFGNVGEMEFLSVDRSLLELLLNEADQVVADHYTADSYAALKQAVSDAKSVDADAQATQRDVDAANTSLESALDHLIYRLSVSLTPSAPNGLNGWYTKPVTVTMLTYGTAEYSMDGGNSWQMYSAPIVLDQDGKYTVNYRTTDYAGDEQPAKQVGINLDATAPTITVTGLVYDTYDDSMDITPDVAISDNLSGVDDSKTTVTLDTYGAVQSGDPIPLYTLPLGEHTLSVTAVDMAGNASSQTIRFKTTASIDSMKALVARFEEAGWIDNKGIANSLRSKLNANALAALENELKAQSGKHITSKTADYLLRDVRYLLSRE